jgi:hypothetical protein
MGLLHSRWFQSLGGGRLEQTAANGVAWIHLRMLSFHKDKEVMRLLRQVRKGRKCLLTGNETFLIYAFARAYAQLPGAMAEVGVYQGVSTKLICEAKGEKELHVFDTFEGLPDKSGTDVPRYKPSQYLCSLESVQEYLKSYPNVHFHKGLFPESAKGLEEMKFRFVHIDVDLYESTKGCLEWFYPRLLPGAILVSHDYSLLAGVRQAFTEFFADKPETPLELPTTQCMIVKL